MKRGSILACHHGVAIRGEGDTATEDDRDRFLDAAVGQGEGRVGFLGEGLHGGLELRMLEDASGVCYALHDHLLSA